MLSGCYSQHDEITFISLYSNLLLSGKMPQCFTMHEPERRTRQVRTISQNTQLIVCQLQYWSTTDTMMPWLATSYDDVTRPKDQASFLLTWTTRSKSCVFVLSALFPTCGCLCWKSTGFHQNWSKDARRQCNAMAIYIPNVCWCDLPYFADNKAVDNAYRVI